MKAPGEKNHLKAVKGHKKSRGRESNSPEPVCSRLHSHSATSAYDMATLFVFKSRERESNSSKPVCSRLHSHSAIPASRYLTIVNRLRIYLYSLFEAIPGFVPGMITGICRARIFSGHANAVT